MSLFNIVTPIIGGIMIFVGFAAHSQELWHAPEIDINKAKEWGIIDPAKNFAIDEKFTVIAIPTSTNDFLKFPYKEVKLIGISKTAPLTEEEKRIREKAKSASKRNKNSRPLPQSPSNRPLVTTVTLKYNNGSRTLGEQELLKVALSDLSDIIAARLSKKTVQFLTEDENKICHSDTCRVSYRTSIVSQILGIKK